MYPVECRFSIDFLISLVIEGVGSEGSSLYILVSWR